MTPSTAIGAMVLGAAFVAWALRSRHIRDVSGFRNKLKLLASRGFEGPDGFGKMFVVGIGAFLFGLVSILRP